MAQLLEFFGNHTLLFALLFGIAGALVWTFIGAQGNATKISPMQATRLINDEDALVLDVRAEAEFSDGHVVNAVHAPLSELPQRIDKLGKYKSRPVISICRTGQQSAQACGQLRKNGFENCYSVTGGIVAWREANLPLTTK